MKRLLFALMVWGFALSIGTGGALAGGGSDTTGEGLHCYLFFDSFPGEPKKFAQAMVNEEDVGVIIEKIDEILFKYVDVEGAMLKLLTGNVEGVCPDRLSEPNPADPTSWLPDHYDNRDSRVARKYGPPDIWRHARRPK